MAIELAHQRMREIGKKPCEYHVDVLSIVGTAAERLNGAIFFKAYNEYLYLIDYQNYYGFVIISDSAFFNATDYTHNTKLQEFTGQIVIVRLPGGWSIDGGGLVLDGDLYGIRRRMIPIDFVRVVIH